MRGLYIHIPFCRVKCHYCDFVITTDSKLEPQSQFKDALLKEADHFKAKFNLRDFDTLYFGGGTPSLLAPEIFRELVGGLRERFQIAAGAEVTLEMNPDDFDAEKLGLYRELGINRISLGVQSMKNHFLKDMGRPHTSADTKRAILGIRQAGFENLSVDLICRLPGQRREAFLDDVEEVIALSPEQVTIYDLDIHEKTVYGVRHERGELELCDDDEHFRMMASAEGKLAKAGYEFYALGCYAKENFQARHNGIYWQNGEYLGLGPGAFSYMNKVRFQLATTHSRYLQKCRDKNWTPEVEDVITETEESLENFATGLRLKEGIGRDRIVKLPDYVFNRLEILASEGYLTIDPDRITLLPRGRAVFDTLMAHLLEKP